ncbi:cholinesterase-like isoform X2 [Oratosquilla oratoria]|uniref:cholinesterase-like isoform X2 n=1 Tax=Oratosquilla oratoria TaxID=337810 RepID=UPI003F761E4E
MMFSSLSQSGHLKNPSGLVCFVLLLCSVGQVATQYRNDHDSEYYRYDADRRGYYSRYNTPPPSRREYNSGDVYHGTDRRYDTRYDDETARRNFENRRVYEEENFGNRFSSRKYDSRGRLRPGSERRPWDNRNSDHDFGVLGPWRDDLQGEQRPSEIPGETLPLTEDLMVNTDTGQVQGFFVYLYDEPRLREDMRPVNRPLNLQYHIRNVSVFLGIPYARPPILEGRFKPPRRVPKWYATWLGVDFQPACPQNLKYTGVSNGIRNGINEDCLYLNIYTPSISINVRDKFPVMFYVHGGDFDHGASNQFPGHMLSSYGEVVVVTFNYRLGALGWLSTGDDNSPGNYGLMDMGMALEWVYNNIRFFNGNRDQITVFGPGAGGAAAGLLAVLPKTYKMVSQVIAESGSPLADWAALDDPFRVQNTSRVYGLEVGCGVETSYKLLNCLVRRSYEELAAAAITPDLGTFAWGPVVDYNFTVPGDGVYEDWTADDWHILPDKPKSLYMRNNHHLNLRYLTGVNRDEAANFVKDDLRLSKRQYEVTEAFFDERIKEWVKHYNYSLNPEGAYEAIRWMYTFWPDPHNTTHIREQYIHMLSDALYKSSVDEMVKLLVNTTNKRSVPTYYYVLNTTVEAMKLPKWREVPHNIEYYLISGAPFMDPEFYPSNIRVSRSLWSEGDRNMSEFMMKTFSNFARWGKPTYTQVLDINWQATEEGTLKYLSINNTFNTTMRFNYRQPQNTFWYEYMPHVVLSWVPTVPPPVDPWLQLQNTVTAGFYGTLVVCVFLLVIVFVCCGLWRSANRERNKALDIIEFSITEPLNVEEPHGHTTAK